MTSVSTPDEPLSHGDDETLAQTAPVSRNPTVLGISLASLLSDAGHEMATAALPGFLRTIAAPAAALGAIEGIADASLSAAKVAGGLLADRPGVARKRVAGGGYTVTALSHAASPSPTPGPR